MSERSMHGRPIGPRRATAMGLCLVALLIPKAGVTLSAEEEALVDDLTHSLVAPCCWTASVAEHGTGQAPVLEAEIREMVAEGTSRSAILDHYVETYGERILVEPRRRGFNALAYWIPWVAVAIGAALIARVVKRRRTEEHPVAAVSPESARAPYHHRVREELLRLED